MNLQEFTALVDAARATTNPRVNIALVFAKHKKWVSKYVRKSVVSGRFDTDIGEDLHVSRSVVGRVRDSLGIGPNRKLAGQSEAKWDWVPPSAKEIKHWINSLGEMVNHGTDHAPDWQCTAQLWEQCIIRRKHNGHMPPLPSGGGYGCAAAMCADVGHRSTEY